MEFFQLYRTRRKHNVSLKSVAIKLNLSEDKIISILQNAGFDIFYFPSIRLNEDHLEVLSNSYVESIKSYHNSKSKKYYNLNFEERHEFNHFFYRFIKKSYNIWEYNNIDVSLDKVVNSNLDNDLIKDFFFNLVSQIEYHETISNGYYLQNIAYVEKIFNKYRHKIKLRLKHKLKSLLSDIRTLIHSILVCCHYYIFSDDEDHNGEAARNTSFFVLRNTQLEALIIINYLKFHKQWKILNYS